LNYKFNVMVGIPIQFNTFKFLKWFYNTEKICNNNLMHDIMCIYNCKFITQKLKIISLRKFVTGKLSKPETREKFRKR